MEEDIRRLENLFEELRFLNLADNWETISNYKIKEDNFSSAIIKNLFDSDFIHIYDVGEFPNHDYKITEKGKKYANKIRELISNNETIMKIIS